MSQLSDEILDTFVSPELSQLALMGAPALDPQPDFLAEAIYCHMSGLRWKKERKALLHLSITFLKRSFTATNEYRAGRENLMRYIEGLARPTHDLPSYLSALSQFEQCIGSVAQCIELFNTMNRYCVPKHPRAFKPNDGSDVQRICELNNTIKHFEANQAAASTAPVWITNSGIKSSTHYISFEELVENIKALWKINRINFVEIPKEAQARSGRAQ